jgi:glycosyltransferase involved in cell wall biosynthesis
VVATSHDGAPEVVADQETGLIVPPFSTTDFTEALFTLLNDVELRNRMARQARRWVLGKHDMSDNYRTLFQGMEKICGRRRA